MENEDENIPLFEAALVTNESEDTVKMSLRPQPFILSEFWEEFDADKKLHIMNYLTATMVDLFMLKLTDSEQMEFLSEFKKYVNEELDEVLTSVDKILKKGDDE